LRVLLIFYCCLFFFHAGLKADEKIIKPSENEHKTILDTFKEDSELNYTNPLKWEKRLEYSEQFIDSPEILSSHNNKNQTENSTETITFSKEYLTSYFSDTQSILSSPARWKKKQWVTFSVFAGITATLLIFDEDIQEWSQRNKLNKWSVYYEEDYSDKIAGWVKPFGDYNRTFVPLGLLYAFGSVTENDKLKSTVLYGLESLVISNLFGQALKRTINRERPSGWGIHHEWGADHWSEPNRSMPSGHAITVFSLATVFATQYRDNRWVPPVAYTIATLTAASRVHENRHWTSDVFVGACIGYFTSKAILKIHSNKKVTFMPYTDGKNTSVIVSFKF
jgi:membrane-associated phospholipid phosphatase